ncbi:hypothetical protein [Streptomyces sp. NPDC006668]|uniref:hypothetical protein n=1 Tax=Streptomyces sp. NPDC006668 TaxID=3156903 RepID=UPI0033DB1294
MLRCAGYAYGVLFTEPAYGIGSATDTARYRTALAAHHRVPVDAVHGYVIGEHGDGAVICASATTIHGAPCTVPLDLVAPISPSGPAGSTPG